MLKKWHSKVLKAMLGQIKSAVEREKEKVLHKSAFVMMPQCRHIFECTFQKS